MPWTVGDVDSHKKGLTPAQKSKWVSIANAALKRCQAKGGSGCDASAIRIANAAFSYDAVYDEEGFVYFLDVDVDDCCEFAVSAGEPLANFHSCRLKEPNYPEYAYKKCAAKSGGKCIDHVYGIPKEGGSQLQAMRYPVSSWSSAEARSNCGGKGTFTAAKRSEKKQSWDDSDIQLHDEFFAFFEEEGTFQEDKDKPGGSNQGKYKKGPFCGPSGGAPSGTYPVNTKGRAQAAIAYARHAPNPSGIKKCVCRHWPSLPSCKTKKTSLEVETMSEKQKLPKAALHFMDHECFAKVISDADGAKAKLNMVCYSGKPIKKHWYWGDLVIDLSGMSFPKKKFPILENHREDRKIGFSNGKPLVEEHQLRLDPEKVEFVETPYSDEFIRLSKQGFPYESSIYAVPSSVERLEPGTSAEVNGFTMKGPATIWRQCTFKEASICVFGHDSNTHSEAFAEGDIELELEVANLKLAESDQQESTEKEVIEDMTLAELKEKNPEVFSALSEEIRGEVTAELQAKFDQEKKDLENKHSQEKDGLTGRILELEKKDEIRSMNEMRSRAASIWTSKLSESNIPDHLFEKVSQHVSYSKFVKDGVLDEKGFHEAIDAEIKDWESKGVTSSVLGMSFTKKGETDDSGGDTSQEAKENEEAVNQLAALAGLPAN